MKKLLYLFSITIFLASCGTTMHTGGDVISPNKAILNVDQLNAEVIVDQSKVLSGVSTTTVAFMIFRTGDNTFLESKLIAPATGATKKAAMFKALENTGYDILVNPKYIIKKSKAFFGLIKSETVQVSGYGGKIKIK